jgi:thioredoxin reductase (NADPH)
MALGELDYWIHRRWEPVEEILYPIVGDLLADWSRATRRPRYETVRVIGEATAPRSHELRSLLERSMLPYGFYPHDSGEGRRLLKDVGQDGTRLPVVIIADEHVLLAPSNSEVLAPLGVKTRPAHAAYDVVVVGAGPAGLSSAVYAASEGLRTLILEPEAAGGQAAASSRIRNYLGFPRGISGGMLAMWAFQQAVLFGAEFVYQAASQLKAHGAEYVVSLDDGSEVRARAVIVSTGVSYRRLNVPGEDRFVGSGVFYGAASSELPAVRGQHVFVVGGGNSAGQAAIHLAAHASDVTLLVRGDSLAESMSDYLIRELDVISNVTIRIRTRVAEVRGTGRLEALRLQDTLTGEVETVAAGAIFLLIGGRPRTQWLRGVVDQDSHGYLLTGRNCVTAPGGRVMLQTSRALLETSAAGVFAAGDVRHGSVKRVATAVGEGAMAVRFVHEFLQQRSAPGHPLQPLTVANAAE